MEAADKTEAACATNQCMARRGLAGCWAVSIELGPCQASVGAGRQMHLSYGHHGERDNVKH